MFWEGVGLIAASSAWLFLNTHTMIVSKVMPLPDPLAHPWLNAIAVDRHYCLLPPAGCIIVVALVFLNWLGLKYFRHN